MATPLNATAETSASLGVDENFGVEASLAHRVHDLLRRQLLRPEVDQDVLLALALANANHPAQSTQRVTHTERTRRAIRPLDHQLRRHRARRWLCSGFDFRLGRLGLGAGRRNEAESEH